MFIPARPTPENFMNPYFQTEYRIVRDDYAGYEVQRKFWWVPFWIQSPVNTHATEEDAVKFARSLADGSAGVVKHLGRL